MSEEQQDVVIPGPGEILKKARQAASLSTQDIASKLRLKNALIEDLEQDNYDINISLTFIKGYLKLYAKHVSVPENVIVDAFEKHNTQNKEPAKLQSFSRRFSHQANDDKLMLVTYLIVAAVIALVVVWWFQQSDGDSKVASLLSSGTKAIENVVSNEPKPEQELNIPVPTQIKNVQAKQLKNQSAILSSDAAIETSIDKPITGSFVNEQSAAIEDNAVVNEVSSTIKEQEKSIEAVIQQTNSDVNIEAVTSDITDTTAAQTDIETLAEPVELIFEFADNCWMNLADATGENIAYGVKVKGRVMPITGIPPFVVTLGAPEVVKVSYAGEEVDMSFIPAGRSAKFELPLKKLL
jgi:cytoskeleton protein RodZ